MKNLIKQFAFKLLAQGPNGGPVRVLRGPARGTYLDLDLRSQASYWIGQYDRWILDRVPLEVLIKPGEVAWDCGAFVAYYTALFRKLVGESGDVHAFEASPANAARILELPNLNGWRNVSVHQFAIGPDHAEITFSAEQGGASGPVGLVEGERSGIEHGLITVRSAGIDEIVYEDGIAAPNFIKFDLETGEVFALANGHRLFSEKRPTILLELHGQRALEASLEFAATYDYSICDVYHLPADAGRSARSDFPGWLTQFSALAERFVAAPPEEPPHMTLVLPNELLERRGSA